MPLFATPGNFVAITYCFFIFVAKEKSPDILIELSLGLLNTRNFNFSCTHIIILIVLT